MLKIGVIEFRSTVSLPKNVSNDNQRVTFDSRLLHLFGNISQRADYFSFLGPGGFFNDRDRGLLSVAFLQLGHHPLDFVNLKKTTIVALILANFCRFSLAGTSVLPEILVRIRV